MRIGSNRHRIREGTPRQIEERSVTARRSASINAIACAMAWFVMAAGVPSQAVGKHTVTGLNEQLKSRHLETTRSYSAFEAVGVADEGKHALKVQQSDPLADVKIAEQVKAAVRRDPDVRTVDVVVFVSGGVVTLSGTVSTPHQRSQAEKLASQVEGVTAVVNKIKVSSVRP